MVTLGPKQLMTVSTVLLAMSSAGLITGRVFLQVIDCTRLLFCHSRLFCHTQPLWCCCARLPFHLIPSYTQNVWYVRHHSNLV